MWSYTRVSAALALCVGSLSACSSDGDYQVAVSWTINGTIPNAEMCQEQGIARVRFEVSAAGGKRAKTVEGNCSDTIWLSNGSKYGGFYTNASFHWDEYYDYSITMIDAAGNPVSQPRSSSFNLPFDQADIYELSYLDYVNPVGRSATLSGDWAFANGSAASVATDCQNQNVSKVRIFATSALEDPQHLVDAVPVAEADCQTGRFDSPEPILATGNYFFFYQAIGSGNNVVTSSPLQEIFVDFGDHVVLQRATFFAN